jgi:hypothetical protein
MAESVVRDRGRWGWYSTRNECTRLSSGCRMPAHGGIAAAGVCGIEAPRVPDTAPDYR